MLGIISPSFDTRNSSPLTLSSAPKFDDQLVSKPRKSVNYFVRMSECHRMQLFLSFQNLSSNLNLLIGKRLSLTFAAFARHFRPSESGEMSRRLSPATLLGPSLVSHQW